MGHIKINKGEYKIFKSLDRKFYFHLRASNTEIILRTHGANTVEETKADVEFIMNDTDPSILDISRKGKRILLHGGTTKGLIVIFKGEDGQFYFRYLNDFVRILGTSEGYLKKPKCRHGIISIGENRGSVVKNLIKK